MLAGPPEGLPSLGGRRDSAEDMQFISATSPNAGAWSPEPPNVPSHVCNEVVRGHLVELRLQPVYTVMPCTNRTRHSEAHSYPCLLSIISQLLKMHPAPGPELGVVQALQSCGLPGAAWQLTPSAQSARLTSCHFHN